MVPVPYTQLASGLHARPLECEDDPVNATRKFVETVQLVEVGFEVGLGWFWVVLGLGWLWALG